MCMGISHTTAHGDQSIVEQIGFFQSIHKMAELSHKIGFDDLQLIQSTCFFSMVRKTMVGTDFQFGSLKSHWYFKRRYAG